MDFNPKQKYYMLLNVDGGYMCDVCGQEPHRFSSRTLQTLYVSEVRLKPSIIDVKPHIYNTITST